MAVVDRHLIKRLSSQPKILSTPGGPSATPEVRKNGALRPNIGSYSEAVWRG